MRNKNYYINLNDREYLDVLSSLMNKRNKLIQSGKYTDGIDEVIMKIKKAKKRTFRVLYMTLYGMSESDSYYQGYNREAIAKGNWTGSADEIAQRIANGFKNSSSHWSYLGSSEYSYIAVGCTYDEASSMWYCCICVSSKNYGG